MSFLVAVDCFHRFGPEILQYLVVYVPETFWLTIEFCSCTFLIGEAEREGFVPPS